MEMLKQQKAAVSVVENSWWKLHNAQVQQQGSYKKYTIAIGQIWSLDMPLNGKRWRIYFWFFQSDSKLLEVSNGNITREPEGCFWACANNSVLSVFEFWPWGTHPNQAENVLV